MAQLKAALRRRIAPSHKLTLNLVDDDGSKFTKTFLLSFDINVAVLIEERTGLGLANGEVWDYIQEKLSRKPAKHGPKQYGAHPSISHVVSIMLWAAVLPHHGDEYDSDEGLAVLRSYMDVSNFAMIAGELEQAFIATLPKETLDALKRKDEEEEDEGEIPLVSASQPTGSPSGLLPGTSESPTKNSAA